MEKLSFLCNVKKFKNITDVSCLLGVDNETVNREYTKVKTPITDSIDEGQDDYKILEEGRPG